MKLLLALSFVGTLGLVAALTAAGDEEIYMNGPLQDGHRFLQARHERTGERYCDRCHTPITGASDPGRCLECHYGVTHVPAAGIATVTTACLTCHLEHSRGEDPLVSRGERACRSCHPRAETTHAEKMYIVEQGIPLRSCLNAKGCHLNEYHELHAYAPPKVDFVALHDKEGAAYDESRCIDCHGEPRELVDRYRPRFYAMGEGVTPSEIQRLMSAAGRVDGRTSIHRVHMARMNLGCDGCHRIDPESVGSPTSSPMAVKKCCHCHSATTTPPRMWCGISSGALAS